MSVESLPLVGYYAGGWIWPDDQFDGVKSLLPFFDMLSLILPPGLVALAVREDDVIAQPLIDLGILETRNPADALDQKRTAEIVEWIRAIMDARPCERVLEEFAELIVSPQDRRSILVGHLGLYNDAVRDLLYDLQDRGLAGALDPKTGLFPLDATSAPP